ncbi:MAG TPA: 4-(cytidine 5'-diphospho)-2-C-methyl-D-erythritol kinase [Planctomycetota bacterium]|jgi:4-diphosphocytidyl-2-C-methyl-D-erythritol kinase|nr:4-(cytidine 5'-diphospho)-2-C-methyl-D-erythritol kinase [Planctomycetota bacterium]
MPPRSVQLRCPAKLNLFLEVLGRRPDGYHELSTVMVPVALYDTLTVREAKGFRLDVDGPPLPGTNTVEKAYRAVAKRRKIPGVRASLVKGIPAGSGMGGGSSDAAAMIEALDTLFDLGLDRHEVAAEIGSDVNFFLERGPALCSGRGEKVAPIASGPDLHAVIFWPGFSLSTAAVYARVREFLTPRPRVVIDFLNSFGREGPEELGRVLFNRLELAAFALHPELSALRGRLAEMAGGARMTGSGSALYGLCASGAEASRLARRVRGQFAGFVAPAALLSREDAWKSRKSGSSSSAAARISSAPSVR